MLGSQLGFTCSRCEIDSEALPAAKAAGVEADMNEPGVPSSQRCRKFATPSVPIARDHPDDRETRVGWSMDTPCTILVCSQQHPLWQSLFFLHFPPPTPFPLSFHKKPKQGALFPPCTEGIVSQGLSQYHLGENPDKSCTPWQSSGGW